MAELKTQPSDADVAAFLASVEPESRRKDCEAVAALMARTTGSNGRMWGSAIVGFGTYSYENAAGKTAEWMLTAFSPRKAALTLYIMSGFDTHDALVERLGKIKTGKSCLYIKSLSDIDISVLEELITQSINHMRARYRTA